MLILVCIYIVIPSKLLKHIEHVPLPYDKKMAYTVLFSSTGYRYLSALQTECGKQHL